MSSVDVIVPCYRYAHFLRECVESVLTQPIQDLRVLIIDDASPDNTEEVAAGLIRADPRVTFRRHDQNRGHINTYNEGIDWAAANYMLILSADDYLLPGALRRAIDLMDAHPEVGFSFGKGIELRDNGVVMQASDIPGSSVREKPAWHIVGGLEFIELSGAENVVSTPTAVVRTELQKRLGGYHRELPHSGDMEMWLRFAANAYVGILEAHQAVYRRHRDNMSTRYMSSSCLPDIQQRKAALDLFFETCNSVLPNAPQLHRKLFWSLARCAVGFASTAFNKGEMEISQQLSKFALDLCPDLERSWPWAKLRLKYLMGPTAWTALRPAVTNLRKLAGSKRTKSVFSHSGLRAA